MNSDRTITISMSDEMWSGLVAALAAAGLPATATTGRTDQPERLRERIRAERGRQGLSQEQLAERAGVTPQTVCKLENGRRNPHAETLHRLAAALGIEARGHDMMGFGETGRRPSNA